MGKRGEKEDQFPRMRKEVANIFMRRLHHLQMSWRSGRFLVTGKRQVSHSSSRRAGRMIRGQPASQPPSLGRLRSKSQHTNEKVIGNSQRGLAKAWPRLWLLPVTQWLASVEVECGWCCFLDCSKAFNMVLWSSLTAKLMRRGLDKQTVSWMESRLGHYAERSKIPGPKSSRWSVTRGSTVPAGGQGCRSEGPAQAGEVSHQEPREVQQKQTQVTPCTSRVRGRPAGERLCSKGPGGPGGQTDREPAVCPFAAKAANRLLGWIRKSLASGRDPSPLYNTCKATSGYCVQFWSPHCKKNIAIPSKSSAGLPRWSGATLSTLERCHRERLSEPRLYSLEKRRLRGDFSAGCSYLVGGYREARAKLFLEVHSDRMRRNGHSCDVGSSA